nr:hypothetical protein [Tanacetum cinerariifolium]
MQNGLRNANTDMIINERQEQPHARTKSHKTIHKAISDAVEYHHQQPPHKTRTPPPCVSSSHMSTHESSVGKKSPQLEASVKKLLKFVGFLAFLKPPVHGFTTLHVPQAPPSSSSPTTITTETSTTSESLLAAALGRAIFNIKSTSFQDALTTTTTTTTNDQIARQLSDATSSVTQYLSTQIPMQNGLRNANTDMIINERQEQPHARTKSHKPIRRAISAAVEYHHQQPPHKTRTPPPCVSSSHMSTHESSKMNKIEDIVKEIEQRYLDIIGQDENDIPDPPKPKKNDPKIVRICFNSHLETAKKVGLEAKAKTCIGKTKTCLVRQRNIKKGITISSNIIESIHGKCLVDRMPPTTIIFTTVFGCQERILQSLNDKAFDLLIIDEAGKMAHVEETYDSMGLARTEMGLNECKGKTIIEKVCAYSFHL